MIGSWLRLLEHLHGHIACLATIALFHPVALLRNPNRRIFFAAATATLSVTFVAALGLVLYPSYRAQLKPAIFVASRALGLAFERKEHLAMAVVVLAWVGLFAHVAETKRPSGVGSFGLARFAYSASAALALLTAGLGISVAVGHTF